MLDCSSVKTEVTSIVNNLAKSVVTEIITVAEKCSVNKQAQSTEEELDALVDDLCVKAIDKILKIVELAASKQDNPPSKCYVSPQTEENKEDLNRPQLTEVINKTNSTPGGDLDKALHSEASASPPTPAECPDHEYALPSSTPSATPGQDSSTVPQSQRRPGVGSRRKRARHSSTAERSEARQECKRCGMLFPSLQQLRGHERKAHPVCRVCGMLFPGVLKLREHESRVHQVLPYSCDYCHKSFSHKAHRNLHVMARHTGEKTCHCDICGKGYSCISMLKTHRLTHFDKSFTCDVCGKSFYHACHLTRHKHVHKEVRPYQCPTCGKGFTQAENLKSHQTIHTGERQLCFICGKSYRCLKNHMISKHSHEVPAEELPAKDSIVPCEICGKKFPNPSQYKVHKRTHTGEKPFHCDICGKSYRLKETLRDHKYTHTGEKPYKCTLCVKTFNTATSFMRHSSIHTGEMPYSCQECGKQFRLLTFLKAHQQTKSHLRQTMSLASSGDITTQVASVMGLRVTAV
ncbi:uncharacterized protein ACJ7VT_015767 isoform 2-T2 [Polymixia lowei]